jgi:hypothetical protein
MSRLVIFKAEDSSAPGWEARTLQVSGSLTDLLGQYFDYSNGPAPDVGYRLPEFKHDDAAATFDHRGGVTHQRLSPWNVSRVDEYVGNTGQETMDDVVIAYCAYAPLPENENPWVEMAPAIVSLESFGGDVAAYDAWKSRQVVTV